jgi:hypothetical protein
MTDIKRALITLRCPTPDQPELVITENGELRVYQIGYNLTRQLAEQFMSAALRWPIDH